jgi:hypothetical protein
VRRIDPELKKRRKAAYDRKRRKSHAKHIAKLKRAWKLRNIGHVIAQKKRYYRENRDFVLSRCLEWRLKNKTRKALTTKMWAKRNPDKVRGIQKRYQERNPLKVQARSAVAIRWTSDPLFRKPCQNCGKKKSEAHHHKGYQKKHWLDVQWLCRKCHQKTHQVNH